MRHYFFAALTTIATLSAPALAQPPQLRSDPAQTKPRSAPVDAKAFAMHMANHERHGIAMADAVIANGTSDEVKSLARRIKADQQKALAKFEAKAGPDQMGPKGQGKGGRRIHPDMERRLAQLNAAKGAEADRMFLEMMITHHAAGLLMAHHGAGSLADADMKATAQTLFSNQARDIGELQRLREANRSASK